MNITILPSRPNPETYSREALVLAQKLECAATGQFPAAPRTLFCKQAQALCDSPDLTHSVAASLCEVLRCL